MPAIFSRKKLAIFFAVIALGASAGLASNYMSASASESKIAQYYLTIDTQEVLDDSVQVTPEDRNSINRCKEKITSVRRSADECMRDFYDRYAMAQGVEKAFSHMARLEREQPDLLANCHYISHGIGHAAFRLSKNDVGEAFALMNKSPLYKNLATCGNGYFHGITEELVKDVWDRDELIKILSAACENATPLNRGNCFHGIGHAALIQTEYDVDAMTYICDRVSRVGGRVFSCLTGGFMEGVQSNPDVVTFENGKADFKLCDTLPEKYQVACYLEDSALLDIYAGTSDYSQKIGLCKGIPGELNRMACVKLFAIRAVRLAHYKDIERMCGNTSSVYERVMCTAIVSDKVGASIDEGRESREYADIISNICGTLQGKEETECLRLARDDRSQLFYTTKADLSFAASAPGGN